MKFNPVWEQQVKERRFSALLVILLVLLAGPPILLGFGLSTVWFDGLMTVLLIAAIVSLCLERQQRLFVLILGIPTVLISLGSYLAPALFGEVALLLGNACEAIFFFCSAVLIVRSLFVPTELSSDSILGAICGYLFLGLGWAVLYSLLEHVQPGSFTLSEALASSGKESRPPGDILTYYSLVTLTTVGYGDVVPATPISRTCAWMEASSGQFYVAVVVAGLISMLVTKRSASQN
jgi:voltage-gated potassium channel